MAPWNLSNWDPIVYQPELGDYILTDYSGGVYTVDSVLLSTPTQSLATIDYFYIPSTVGVGSNINWTYFVMQNGRKFQRVSNANGYWCMKQTNWTTTLMNAPPSDVYSDGSNWISTVGATLASVRQSVFGI